MKVPVSGTEHILNKGSSLGIHKGVLGTLPAGKFLHMMLH